MLPPGRINKQTNQISKYFIGQLPCELSAVGEGIKMKFSLLRASKVLVSYHCLNNFSIIKIFFPHQEHFNPHAIIKISTVDGGEWDFSTCIEPLKNY